jgi:hypothetical protein
MSKLENYLSRLSTEELCFAVYYLNFINKQPLYRLENNFEVYYLCPESRQYEPLVHELSKCKTCAEAASIRAFMNAVNTYNRLYTRDTSTPIVARR